MQGKPIPPEQRKLMLDLARDLINVGISPRLRVGEIIAHRMNAKYDYTYSASAVKEQLRVHRCDLPGYKRRSG